MAFRIKMAKQTGEAKTREFGFVELPVDPNVIATQNDIVVEAKDDAEEGVSGMLLRHGNQFGILYATHIASEGFQRFSIAHELGHYFLDGHIDHVLPTNGVHASRAGFVTADSYELEADHFAAGLLMPERLFRKAMGRQNPSLAAIEALARAAHTSLTATAIRFAELSEDAVAVVISTGREIDYCFLSDTMKSLPKLAWLRKGSPVPSGTATARMNADPARVAHAERTEDEIEIMDWLGGTRSMAAVEEVVGLGSYGKTLTVITCPALVDETYKDDDEEDEDRLVDSWTPHFRR